MEGKGRRTHNRTGTQRSDDMDTLQAGDECELSNKRRGSRWIQRIHIKTRDNSDTRGILAATSIHDTHQRISSGSTKGG